MTPSLLSARSPAARRGEFQNPAAEAGTKAASVRCSCREDRRRPAEARRTNRRCGRRGRPQQAARARPDLNRHHDDFNIQRKRSRHAGCWMVAGDEDNARKGSLVWSWVASVLFGHRIKASPPLQAPKRRAASAGTVDSGGRCATSASAVWMGTKRPGTMRADAEYSPSPRRGTTGDIRMGARNLPVACPT